MSFFLSFFFPPKKTKYKHTHTNKQFFFAHFCTYFYTYIHTYKIKPGNKTKTNYLDITTILLVDNNNRSAHGRFLNVKPAVGLLTSTARTFIQDGVTTEYATQVLGKTIDNGRLYAQLLTKSSRVVYSNTNSPNDIDSQNTAAAPTTVYNNQVVPTQVIGIPPKHYANVHDKNQTKTTTTKKDDDNNVVTFIKNTDYISPNNPSKVHHQHQEVHTQIAVGGNAVNFGSGEEVEFELLPESLAQVRHLPAEEKAEVRQSFSVSESSSSSSGGGGGGDSNDAKNVEVKVQVNPDKVRPPIELPTFTIPSGYQFEGIETNLFDSSDSSENSDEQRDNFAGSPQAIDIQTNRIGKQLNSISIPIAGFTEEEKQLQSVTYYGFADFTTIVGNTVIVFSPNTAPPSTGKVTSIKGEATLRPRIDATKTLKHHQNIPQTKLAALNSIEEANQRRKPTTQGTTTTTTTTTEKPQKPKTTTSKPITTTTESQEEITTILSPGEISSTETAEEQSVEELEQKSLILAKEQNSLKYKLSPSVIEASEVQTATEEVQRTPTVQIVAASSSTASKKSPAMLSIPSDDDIQKILASLNAGNQNKGTEESAHVQQTAETLTGATTIFIDDDPFALFGSTTQDSIAPSVTIINQNTERFETTTENEPLTTTSSSEEEDDSEETTTLASTTTTTTQTPTTESSSEEDDEDDDDEDVDGEKLPETTTTLNTNEELHEKPECDEGFTLKPSTVYRTLTYLTTYFIPDEENDSETSTSIEANDVVQTDVLLECSRTAKPEVIKATSVQKSSAVSTATPEKGAAVKISVRNKLQGRLRESTTQAPTTTTEAEPITETSSEIEEQIDDEPNELNATTEHAEGNTVEAITSSVSTSSTTEANKNTDDDEIELIYKTLFTTYTYLTTFFHGYTSSVSSRKEVVTNIVTSTLDMSLIRSDAALADLVASMSANQAANTERINPTKTAGRAFASATASSSSSSSSSSSKGRKEQPISIEDVFDENAVSSNLNQATPRLSDKDIQPSQSDGSIKTFYTTYTYYTTIFADGETEIASRTEVYTNFVGPSIKPSQLVEEDKIFATKSVNAKLNEVEGGGGDRTHESSEEDLDNHVIQPSYSTMVRSSDSASNDVPATTPVNNGHADDEENATTDSSSEESEESTVAAATAGKWRSSARRPNKPSDARGVSNNVENRFNNILEDQISSESQNEEILPSSTLLVQTSFTTFTYFTTQYIGDSSEVLSRLETITNVITQTLQPTQTVVIAPPPAADEQVPTTYFTTFTYWTTLFKDGEVITTSNTQIVSNVVQPTSTQAIEEIVPTSRVAPVTAIPSIVIATPSIVQASTLDSSESGGEPKSVPSSSSDSGGAGDSASIVTPTPSLLEPTTYYITYTYYTTSYIGDSALVKSRFETVTNVVTPSATVTEAQATPATVAPVGRAINLDNVNSNQIASGPKSGRKNAKEKFAEKQLNEPIISINAGKIIDAEGISTIFYTTKAIGTYIDGSFSQTTEKTSSVKVDELKRSQVLAATPNYAENKHRTGLVRLIDGKIIANHTTTLYQSKVIGTVINNRYAQIIESTSSYIIDKTQDPAISPTATNTAIRPTESVISPSSAVVEGSISSGADDHHHDGDGSDDENEDEVDENGRKKSRLTFATKKKTFTPVIRPFASRNRPSFAPKRKNLVASSATIISRSDFTPTITATPAIGGKADTSTRRFSGGLKRTSNAPHANAGTTSTAAYSSGSKRFSRLRSGSANSSGGASSATASVSAPTGSTRGLIRPSSVRPGGAQPSGALGSSRRIGNLFRSSALPGARLSISPSQVRFRGANPTLAPSLRDSTTTKAPESDDESTEEAESNTDAESDAEENKEEEDEAITTTTENARRNNNPLLRFRRPLTSNANRFQPTSAPRTSQAVTVSTRRSPLLGRARSTQTTTTTSTTARPKARTFQKPPALAALSNRPRTSNNSLFPPRGLLKTTTEAPQEEEINDVANESENEEQNADDESPEIDEDSVDPETEKTISRRDNKAAFTPQSALRIRKRTKRQVEYGTRSSSRYRRPTNQAPQISARSSYDDIYYDDVEPQTQRPKSTGTRYQSRYRPESHDPSHVNQQQSNSRPNSQPIRPTKTTAKQSRAQFTLRSGTEKENYAPTSSRSSNFRRTQNTNANNGQTTARRKPLPTSSARTKTTRHRNYGNSYTTDSRSGRGRTTSANSRNTNRGPTRARGRLAPDAIDYEYIPNFDGTITVTHQIPTETTIPVVNNGQTEYKNVITARISTEILGPLQYSTASRAYNGNTLVLSSEATNINSKGQTEISQFYLRETPTTSVTFTPTQINRRKTSFSHIVPSTVYNVDTLVSTIQPQISADAPLANILLSQLLLGNLGAGLPQQQLLGGLGIQMPFNPIQMTQPATPVTEFKTRTTTYVTTLSNAKPTVLPVTFRGKEILTTIFDDKINVVTATEFITDTIVTTPTQIQVQPTQNINNLLLQQILAQQNQQSILQSPQPLNILNLAEADSKSQGLFQDSMLTHGKSPIDIFNDKKNNKKLDDDEPADEEVRNDYPDLETHENMPEQKVERRPPSFKNHNNKKGAAAAVTAKPSPLETSIITLYVSGRKPGEFSTVLSTVITTPDALLHKRAIDEQVKASKLPDFYDIYNAEGSNIDEIFMPAASTTNELNFIESSQNGVEYAVPAETQSLESILGDVSNYVTKSFLF